MAKRKRENTSNNSQSESSSDNNSSSIGNSLPKYPLIRDDSILKSPEYSKTPQNESSFSSTAANSVSGPKTFMDRFIPNRAGIDSDFCYHSLVNKSTENDCTENISNQMSSAQKSDLTPSQRKLNEEIKLLNTPKSGTKRIIDCRSTQEYDHIEALCSSVKMKPTDGTKSSSKPKRVIPSAPLKILDAPDLVNDYYLNLLHWGSNDLLSVALGPSVYLWHSDGHINSLMSLDNSATDDYICSLQWSPSAKYLAIGTCKSGLQLWDCEKQVQVRQLDSHSDRVSSLSWNSTGGDNWLTSGGKDSCILNHDLRIRQHVVSSYIGHTQEVCGLSWSSDGNTLASGGNENMMCIFDAVMSEHTQAHTPLAPHRSSANTHNPRFLFDQKHCAAVKAIAWCPWQRHILSTGGGTADRTIRIWNTTSGENVRSVDTGSQVCAIQWSDTSKELVSSHGFSDNQLILWKYSNMTRIQELRGHTARVLHLAKSPNTGMICSASADETLCFWDIFEKPSTLSSNGSNSQYTAAMYLPLSSPHKKTRTTPYLLKQISSSPGASMAIR